MKIHHIGYLVKKLEKAEKAFLQLGYEVLYPAVHDESRGAMISFMAKDGYVVELVSPVSLDSVVGGLAKRIGNTPYHICYEVEDLDRSVEELRESHYVACGDALPAPALGGRRVIHLIHPHLGMIELVEVGQ